MQEHPDTGRDIHLLTPTENPKSRAFVRSSHSETAAVFSPDGRWIAYAWQGEVYVQRYPGPGPRLQVSAAGGRTPVWSPNGGEIFYLTSAESGGESRVTMAVQVGYEPELTLGKPRRLFELEQRILGSGITRTLDMAPDGERFAMIVFECQQEAKLNVVFNWFEELERQVSSGE